MGGYIFQRFFVSRFPREEKYRGGTKRKIAHTPLWHGREYLVKVNRRAPS